MLTIPLLCDGAPVAQFIRRPASTEIYTGDVGFVTPFDFDFGFLLFCFNL